MTGAGDAALAAPAAFDDIFWCEISESYGRANCTVRTLGGIDGVVIQAQGLRVLMKVRQLKGLHGSQFWRESVAARTTQDEQLVTASKRHEQGQSLVGKYQDFRLFNWTAFAHALDLITTKFAGSTLYSQSRNATRKVMLIIWSDRLQMRNELYKRRLFSLRGSFKTLFREATDAKADTGTSTTMARMLSF